MARAVFEDALTVRRWTLALLFSGALLGDALHHWFPVLQTPLAVLLILGIGLQHGALDHILHAHMHGDPEGPLRQSFALPYVAVIGICWAAFEWIPSVMLGVFLAASAYHFGMSHLRVDAMRRHTTRPDPVSGLVLGAVLLAPLVMRPDALEIMATFGWNLLPYFDDALLPLQLASASAAILGAILHRTWGNGLLVLAGVMVAWFVHDLLLAFALYFALGHAREAFFEEFKERQGVAREFKAFYLRSLPLTAVFVLMASGILWAAEERWLSERAALTFLLAGTLPHIAVIEGWVTARLR